MKHTVCLAEYQGRRITNTTEDVSEQKLLAWAEEALEKDEFLVLYQPKFGVTQMEVVGAEALVRWQRLDGRMIAPDHFVGLFERHGLIERLDFLVLAKTCSMLSRSMQKGIRTVPVSVNFSRVHIDNPRFVYRVNQVVRQYGIPAGLIEIEITESAFIDDLPALNHVIDELHAYGYTVAMDDFGTGFSSLNHLMHIPVDVLKLDRGFLQMTAATRQRAACIIHSLVQMAKALGTVVVAEGVETERELELLRQCGCDMGQGYYFSRPVSEERFTAFLPRLLAI